MTHPVYRTQGWKYVRGVVLRRDRYECQIGLPRCAGRANAVDHIVGLQDGGAPYALDNLRAACKHCNMSKRNREMYAKAKAYAQRRVW
jgi:5-methylcytosine-specific restriction endonuclease McrA